MLTTQLDLSKLAGRTNHGLSGPDRTVDRVFGVHKIKVALVAEGENNPPGSPKPAGEMVANLKFKVKLALGIR